MGTIKCSVSCIYLFIYAHRCTGSFLNCFSLLEKYLRLNSLEILSKQNAQLLISRGFVLVFILYKLFNFWLWFIYVYKYYKQVRCARHSSPHLENVSHPAQFIFHVYLTLEIIICITYQRKRNFWISVLTLFACFIFSFIFLK